MSRSYKAPVYKDGGHWKKQLHWRAFRSKCKQISKTLTKGYDIIEFSTDEPQYPHMWEVTDQWDICDWVHRVSKWDLDFTPDWEYVLVDNSEYYKKAQRK